jgi:hypothetical protein
MSFKTKLDFSNNRQVKQNIETITVLSGATSFGVSFSELPSGPNLSTSGISETLSLIVSTFSGNSGTTIYTWYDPRMELGVSALSPLTPSNSATTQTTGQVYTASSTTIIDGNTVALAFTGVSFDITVIGMSDLGGGNFSGSVDTATLDILSADTLDFTGRTIWSDTSGITRTQDLIITTNPTIGYVFTCSDLEGKGQWQPSSGVTADTNTFTTGATLFGTTAYFDRNDILSAYTLNLSTLTGSTSYWSASSGTNAIVPINHNTTASGINSIAIGSETIAGGDYSFAQGDRTVANNDNAHTEGLLTTASGKSSHAEGIETVSVGVGSHSEGSGTTASGNQSHAEGAVTTASGFTAHAEGAGTIAGGDYSHAEGALTIASGFSSHAEGTLTTAIGLQAHAEGHNTTASGDRSHAEGKDTIASNNYSHAEGRLTIASGQQSHAEGVSTIASGETSHAEGLSTTASGIQSHAEGTSTTANGNFSHAEGLQTTASGVISHAEGSGTIASGNTSHAEGSSTTSIGVSSHAEGTFTTAIGSASHAGGSATIASGNTSFVHGSGSTAGGVNTIVLGSGITGITDNTTFVDALNIKTVGAGPGITDLGVDASGNVVDQASDFRLKENINTINGALEKLLLLRGVTYNWRDKEKGGEALKIGFIAQEVNDVVPELAYYNPNGDYMGVHYKDVTALIVEAIKEMLSGSTSYGGSYLETQTILAEDNNIELNYGGTHETAIGGGITVLHAINDAEHAEIKTNDNGDFITTSGFIPRELIIPVFTPSSSNDTAGKSGSITKDDNYLYVKSNDIWKRTKLEEF